MNVLCSATPCPVILNSTCVFYEGANLLYIGVNTNDSIQTALEKINYSLSNFSAQDLQSVTDKGAVTTNPIILYTEDSGDFRPRVVGAGINCNGIVGESQNQTGVIGVGYLETGVGVLGISDLGIPIQIYGNGDNTPSVEVNLGNTNKGVVIESGESSTGNPIEVNKNGVLKFRVAQNGDVTTDVISANGDVLTLEAGSTKIEINDVDTEINIIAGNFNVNCPISTTFVNANQYRLPTLNTAPATATSTGTLGEIRYTSGFIYVCVATNTWVRAGLATW